MINVSLKVNGYMLSGFDDLRVSLNLYSLSNLGAPVFYGKRRRQFGSGKENHYGQRRSGGLF